MTPEQIDIAQRLVALPSWVWRGAMRWILPGTDLSGRYRGISLDPEAVPDINDDATGGVLLGMLPGGTLVRRHSAGGSREWEISLPGRISHHWGPTLAHAAALALLEVHSE